MTESKRATNSGRKKTMVERLFPETAAGGFCRVDHQFLFYSRVRALMRNEMQVLDLGAGRGKQTEIASGYKRELITIKGHCARVIGADVDDAVLTNPMVDEAVVLRAGSPLPFPSESFHMIVSWAVFEHIVDPELVAHELQRILKPGGWLCAWTPNKWGYVGIGARLVPSRFHRLLLHGLSPEKRKDEDIFPTLYGMNTAKRLAELFPKEQFFHHSYYHNGPPTYHANNLTLARLIAFYSAVVPQSLRQALHIFIQKGT